LVEVARLVVERRPLAEIAPALAAFMEGWLLDPGPGAPVHRLLAAALEGARDDAVGAAVRGTAALEVVEERLLSLRLPTSRFGEPAVHVGTVAGAAGLGFQAVRVLGLCEGALPSPGREDAILPDAMRREAHPLAVPLSQDRVLGQLHAFDRAVRGASRAVVLSAPRSDLERGEREASSILIEAGAALGRPDAARPGPVPDLRSLERTGFVPARAAAAAFREAHPVSEVAWQDRASERGEVPPGWMAGPHLDLARLRELRRPASLGPVDGVVGPGGPFPLLPGLDPERPISASALERLLFCPLAFLYQRVLHWEEPAGAPSLRELDPLSYGSLFHEVMEAFYSAHGQPFVARQRTLSHWKKVAREIAGDRLAALLASYPLAGGGVELKERARLLGEVESFLEYDWSLPLSRFVAVERPFSGLALEAGGERLHVRGYVDRIDVEGDHALVRDLKTGRAHPRVGDEVDPLPGRDVQLGLYGLVARRLAAEWGLPGRLQAAYAYARTGEERAFRGDHAALEKAAGEWLALAARLLAARAFPPTPLERDCAICPFQPVCGPAVPGRAAAAAAGAAGPVRDFFRLKGVAG
ncbi:MAG TPA: PD-(D/E)XK nuclease family protein, partial [Anaeromyxobacteraceae bacterium]